MSGGCPTPCSSAKSTTARRTPGTAAGDAAVRTSRRSISLARAIAQGAPVPPCIGPYLRRSPRRRSRSAALDEHGARGHRLHAALVDREIAPRWGQLWLAEALAAGGGAGLGGRGGGGPPVGGGDDGGTPG